MGLAGVPTDPQEADVSSVQAVGEEAEAQAEAGP